MCADFPPQLLASSVAAHGLSPDQHQPARPRLSPLFAVSLTPVICAFTLAAAAFENGADTRFHVPFPRRPNRQGRHNCYRRTSQRDFPLPSFEVQKLEQHAALERGVITESCPAYQDELASRPDSAMRSAAVQLGGSHESHQTSIQRNLQDPLKDEDPAPPNRSVRTSAPSLLASAVQQPPTRPLSPVQPIKIRATFFLRHRTINVFLDCWTRLSPWLSACP